MNKFIELKNQFTDKKITKAEFIEKMGEIHSILFDYQELLETTNSNNIDIIKSTNSDNGGVILTLNSGIKLHCIKNDNRVIPIEILNFGNYEETLWDKFINFINFPKTIFDIGGNIGYFSFYMAKKFPEAKIYSFEPIPKTYEYAQKNLLLNNFQNISIYNFGLTNKKQTIEMFYNPKGCGGSSIKNLSDEDYIERVQCEFSTLDDFVKENNIENIDVIKCDVEGAEKFVYEGGLKTLERFKPIIYSEMLRKWSAKFNYHPNDIIALLKPLGYECFAIDENVFEKIEKIDDNTIQTNFVFK